MEHSLKQSIFLLLTAPLCLFALNGKPEKIKGDLHYSVSDSTEVLQVSDKTILEYRNFNIETHETTKYVQPSSKSTLLCRVKGRNPSTIKGKLEANGKLLFINPNGIIFSETARVNVGTLIASTLDIKNDDFLNDHFKFKLASSSQDSSIVNKGRIEADHDVVFMAPHISNQGVITVKTGKIALMGGEMMTLDFDGDAMIQFAVDAPLKKGGSIEQAGVLVASEVHMKLPTAQKLISSVINDTGVIRADHIVIENGVIYLKEGSYTQAKTLQLSGNIIQVNGELNVPGLCDLNADEAIGWLRANSVGHLKVETSQFLVAGPITAQQWTSHVSGQYVLESSISTNKNELIFDAPVRFQAPDIVLSTGSLSFLEGLESQNIDLCLQSNVNGVTTIKGPVYAESGIRIKGAGEFFLQGEWAAQTGDISIDGNVHLLGDTKFIAPQGEVYFKGTIDGLGGLDVKARSLVLKSDVGHVGFLKVNAVDSIKLPNIGTRDAALDGMLTLHSKGALYFEGKEYAAAGHDYKSSSFEFNSGGKTTLFANTTAPTILHEGPIHLSENTTLEIISNQGPIELPSIQGIQGKKDSNLTVNTPQNHLKIDRVSGIDQLQLSADQMILTSTIDAGSIHLVGQKPVQISHPLKAHTGDLVIEVPLVFAVPEMFLETLNGGSIRCEAPLSGTTKLTLHAKGGDIILKGPLEGNKRFQSITLSGKKIEQHEKVVSTGPVHYAAEEIFLGGDIETNNTITLDAPVTLFKNDTIQLKANKFGKGEIIFQSTLDADVPTRKLSIQNGKSRSQIKGVIGKKGPLGELKINSDLIFLGKDIGAESPGVLDLQMKAVAIACEGSTYYAGKQEWDAHRITFKHEGPVELKTAGADLKIGRKIYLDKTTAFTVDTRVGTRVDTRGGDLDLGEIYSLGLQPITVKTGEGKAALHGVGEMNFPSHVSDLHVTGHTILLRGRIEADKIFMEAKADIKNDHGEPSLIAMSHIKLSAKEGSIALKGQVKAKQIDMEAGADIENGSVVPSLVATDLVKLNAKEGRIILNGKVEAKQITMEAGINIENGTDIRVGEGITPALPSDKLDPKKALIAQDTITLNAKTGSVGGPGEKQYITVSTNAILYVGSKNTSYLKGNCANQFPYAYPSNVPPLVYFNGSPVIPFVQPASSSKGGVNEADIVFQTLAPDLLQRISTGFMDGSTTKPRKAPIYYDTSSK